MSAHSSKRFRFTFHLQSAHFSHPAPSVARDLGKMIQNQLRNSRAPWKPAHQLLSTVSWWHCAHRLCAVGFQGRRFPLPLTMLVGLGIHFHSCSWCLEPLEMRIWHFFQIPLLSVPGPALLCAWGYDICARASSAGSTLPAVFCTAWKQGVQSAAQRVYGIPTYTSMCTHSTNTGFEKPGTTLALRNALLFLIHLSYPPLQCFNDHDIGIYLLL